MFNEANTVEQMILDACQGLGWQFVPGPQLPRQAADVFVESQLRDALIRLNPEIAAQPDRADEVIYKLRAIPLAVQNDGLVRSNEALAEWMRNDKTMPFGDRGEHTTVRLIDFDHPENNELIVCNQWTYKVGQLEKRFDIVLLINGLPVVIGEAKTPVRPAVTWVDGASQIHDDYEQSIPAMFVPNIFSFASDGRAYRYGSIRMPLTIWGPWRLEASEHGKQRPLEGQLRRIAKSRLTKNGSCSTNQGSLADVRKDRREHAATRSGARHSAELHGLRHRQETPTHQDHLSLPTVRRHQSYCRSSCHGTNQEGPDLALSRIRQIAVDGVHRTETADASGTRQSNRIDHR